jgi:hypothetical protein
MGLIVLIPLAFGVYMLPALVADRRDAPNFGTVFAVNALFGWTVVGWVVALRMACRKDEAGKGR